MSSLKARLLIALGTLLVAAAFVAPSGRADAPTSGSTAGYLPPDDPPYVCPTNYKTDPLTLINRCRKREGVGPMTLPSNYAKLTAPQQQLVVYNLERVNRGLPAAVGLNASLDHLAQQGADANDDPPFPDDSTGDEHGNWATSTSVLGADYAWMYYDECSDGDITPGCYGHRDGILIDSDSSDPLVVGAAWAKNNYHGQGFTWNSYAAEFVYGYHPDQLTFSWSDELKYFKKPPALELPGVPTVGAVKQQLSTGGGQTLTIHGTNLSGSPSVVLDGITATHVHCNADGTSCHFVVPPHAPGSADLVVTTAGGSSSPVPVTYAAPGLTRVGPGAVRIKRGQCLYDVKVAGTVGGSPAAKLHVTFAVTNGPAQWQGGGSTVTALTSASGAAHSTSLCDVKRRTGPVSVEASVPGLTAPVTWAFKVS